MKAMERVRSPSAGWMIFMPSGRCQMYHQGIFDSFPSGQYNIYNTDYIQMEVNDASRPRVLSNCSLASREVKQQTTQNTKRSKTTKWATR